MLARQRTRSREAAAWRGRFCVVLATMMLASGASAQERRVTGRVLRPAADTMRGVPGAWVVLHRVAADRSGPIDSTRTSREGGFAIRYIPSGTGDAIYFVSAEHHGIAYFSPPLDTGRAVEEAELAVFDTTSAPVPIHIRGHHIVVAAPGENGDREIVEVFELANDSSVTRVAAGEVPVWSTPLPDGATDVRIGQGDLSEDAIRTDGGRIRLYAPLAPGIKQLSYAYRLDGGAFPFSRPVEGRAGVLEVLLEEPDVTATAPGLERVDPVTVESRTFNRFLAQELPEAGVLRIDAPRGGVDARRALVLAILALTVGAMTLVLVRARRRPVPASPAGERRTERLAREIAELDARVEAAPHLEVAEQETYARRRAELKRELASALDEERRDG
jgi:hypothetical protein